MSFLLICGIWFVSHVAFGADLSLSPTFFELNQSPGVSLSNTFTVFNSSNKPMRAKVYVGDFWYDKRGKRSFPSAGSSPYSAASWIDVPQKEITVPPKSQKDLKFVFAVPPKAPPSAYATLFVERTSKKGKGESAIGIALRIALPILYRKPKAKSGKLKLNHFSFTKPSQYSPLLVKFNLNNKAPIYYFPEGNVLITEKHSKKLIAKDSLPRQKLILPQQTLKFEVPLTFKPKPGQYEGLLTLFYGENKKHIVKKFSFKLN